MSGLSLATGSLTPTTAEGRHAVDRAEACAPRIAAHAERHDREASYVREAHQALAEAGLLGATVPAELGGLGVSSLLDTAACLERVALADASAALALHMQLSRGLSLAAARKAAGTLGAGEAGTGLLIAMAEGTAFVAGAVTERAAGYFTVRTTATADTSGDWSVTGDKLMVSGAPAATHFALRVRVRTPGGDRLGSAIVTRSPATSVGSGWDGLGMRGSGSEAVRFDAAPVLAGSLAVRGPWGVYDPAALGGRMLSSAAMLGLYLGVAISARRQIAGAGDNGIRQGGDELDGVDRELHAVRETVVGLLAALDRRDAADTAGTLTLALDWQRCRQRLHRLTLAVTDLALTTVGARAYNWSSPVSRLLRDCRAAQFMQPYGPLQTARFVEAAARGEDPELLV
ncbi:acyl-CoA dehydrogenase family protein [Streptomyces californicus]|uniref:acyl-CoA dehydrogenase family protein n=1 Tax=Streptomyces californicus TaxID=67351 RepID=UPI0036FA5B7D